MGNMNDHTGHYRRPLDGADLQCTMRRWDRRQNSKEARQAVVVYDLLRRVHIQACIFGICCVPGQGSGRKLWRAGW